MSVDLNLSEEQRQIIASVQDVLTDRFPLSRFRNTHGGDCDSDALADIAGLGWLGLAVEDRVGGAGFSLVEEVLLFRELGRHLVTPSVLAGVLGVHLLLELGEIGLAAEVLSGQKRLCLGSQRAVLDSGSADRVLFWTTTGFCCVPFEQLALEPGRCMDRTVSLRRASMPSNGLRLEGDAAGALRRRADLLVSAQLLGMAEVALELAVEYAKLRQQFGQPIGSFQAIKHRCADMKLRTKVLEALVLMAALAERDGDPGAPLQCAAARVLATRYAIENGAAGIQIHGAMGFTAECDAHLFLLRSHLLESIGSTTAERETQLAAIPSQR